MQSIICHILLNMDISKTNLCVGDILKTGWNTPINLQGKFCSVVMTNLSESIHAAYLLLLAP